MDSKMTDSHTRRPTLPRVAPMMTWVEVADPDGRVRLEARWSVPAAGVRADSAHAA